MRKRAKADGGLTSAALEFLATCPDIWAERRNSGSILQVTPGGGRYMIYLGEDGTPDICGTVYKQPFPIYFGIETKARKGKMRKSQLLWKANAKRWGIPYCEARSLSDVQDFVNYLRGLQR